MSSKAWRLKAENDGNYELAAILRIIEEQEKTILELKAHNKSLADLAVSSRQLSLTVERQLDVISTIPNTIRSIQNPATRFMLLFKMYVAASKIVSSGDREEIQTLKTTILALTTEIESDEELFEIISNALDFEASSSEIISEVG